MRKLEPVVNNAQSHDAKQVMVQTAYRLEMPGLKAPERTIKRLAAILPVLALTNTRIGHLYTVDCAPAQWIDTIRFAFNSTTRHT